MVNHHPSADGTLLGVIVLHQNKWDKTDKLKGGVNVLSYKNKTVSININTRDVFYREE